MGSDDWWEKSCEMTEEDYEARREQETELPPMEHAARVTHRNHALLRMFEVQSMQIALQAAQAAKDEQTVLDRLSALR